MKRRLILVFLLSVAGLFAQHATMPATGYPLLDQAMSGILGSNSGASLPMHCVAGKDIFYLTSPATLEFCTATDTWTSLWQLIGITPENTANKDQANGYAGLDSGGKLKTSEAPTWNQNTTGTALNVTGIVPPANGGTGANNTPGSAGHVLRSNGTTYADSAIQAGDVPTLNQNTTGTAGNLTGLASNGNFTKGNGSGGAVDSGKAVPSGAVVGDTDPQTLSGKTLTSPSLGSPPSPITETWTVGAGGVTANTLVQLDSSTPAKIVAATNGVYGIALSSVSAAGTVEVARLGTVPCTTDTGGATAGDLVLIGSGTVIDCKDSGQPLGGNGNLTSAQRIVGTFRSTATAGNTALVALTPGQYGTGIVPPTTQAHNGSYTIASSDFSNTLGNALTTNVAATWVLPQCGTAGLTTLNPIIVQNTLGSTGPLVINTTTSVFYGPVPQASSLSVGLGAGYTIKSDGGSPCNWAVGGPNPIPSRGLMFPIGSVGGAALTTSSVSGTLVVPFACNIVGYNLAFGAGDSGTATVKFWKIATGTAIPTAANSINTSGVGIASGTTIHSNTITDFTSTSVAAFDIMAMAVTAVTGSPASLTGVLQCNP